MVESHLETDKENLSKKKIVNLKDAYRSAIFRSCREFHKLSDDEKKKYGKMKTWKERDLMLDKFWHYFNERYSSQVLEKIDKETFKIYFDSIKKRGFWIDELLDNDKIQEKLENDATELHVISSTLRWFKKFSKTIWSNVFSDFADFAGFDKTSFIVNSNSKILNIPNIYEVWERFLNTSTGVVLWLSGTKKEQVKNILTPDFDYTEKMLISAMITKIWESLPDAVKSIFEYEFSLPLTAFHSVQSLRNFKLEWDRFLTTYHTYFDKKIIKKLNNLVVTNNDVKTEMVQAWLWSFDGTSWSFSEWSGKYKSVFGKLISVDYFENIQKSQEMFDESVDHIYSTFKDLNPYVNELFKIYPYGGKSYLDKKDSQYSSGMKRLQDEIVRANEELVSAQTQWDKEVLEEKKKTWERELANLEWTHYLSQIYDKNPKLWTVMKKLYSNKFAFSSLNKKEQQVIVDVLIDHKVDNIVKQDVPNLLGVDEKEFKKFIYSFFDLEKDTVKVPTPSGDIPIFFEEKLLVWGKYDDVPWISSLSWLKNLPLNFKINLDDERNKEARNFFEHTELRENIYTSINGQKFNENYKMMIKTPEGESYLWYLATYSDSDIDEKEIDQKDSKKWRYLYDKPLTVPYQERKVVKNIKGDPIKISENDISSYDVQVIDRKINLNGDLLGQMLLGYAVWSSSFSQLEMWKWKTKELEEKFGKMLPYKDVKKNYLDSKKTTEDTLSETLWSKENKIEKMSEEKEIDKNDFMKKRDSLSGYNFMDENKWFEKWTEIFVKLGVSELPPKNLWWDQWMKMTIVDIDELWNRFKIKTNWWELALNPKEWEWKETWLSINEQTLKNRESAFGQSAIYKLPWESKWDSFEDRLLDLKSVSLWIKSFSTFEDDVRFNWSKFIFKDNRVDWASGDVQYFWEKEVDNRVWMENPSEQNILYSVKKVSWNRFHVKSKFIGDRDGKKVRFNYDRKMSYYDFILFVSGKWLVPQNDKQIKKKKLSQEKEVKAKAQDLQWGASWFSIGNIIDFFKNTKNSLEEKIKEYDKDKVEDLTDMLVSDKRMFNKLSGLFWSNFFPSLQEGFKKMHLDFDKDRDTRVRNKIKYWLDIYLWDPHFDSVFKREIQPVLRWEKEPMDKYQMPAALIAMVKKWGPYNRWSKDLQWKGLWVRHLLWKDHFERFKVIREETKQRIKKMYSNYEWIPEPSIDELVKLEIEYIKDTVDGRRNAIKWPNADELYWAKTRSRQFVDELWDAHNKLYSQANIDEKYNKISGAVTFEYAAYEYNRFISSWRIHNALPFYKKMWETMMTPQDRLKFTGLTIATMLSGLPMNVLDKGNRKYMQNIARSVGCLPGILMRDLPHQKDMYRMLNLFTNGRFSTDTIYHFEPRNDWWSPRKYKLEDYQNTYMPEAWSFIDWFVKDWWLKQWNGEIVNKFFEMKNPDLLELMDSDGISDEDRKLLSKIKNKSLEWTQEEVDADVTPNFFAYEQDPLNLNKSVIKPFIKNIQSKQFQWETYQIEAAEEFWNVATAQIPNTNMTGNKTRLSYMIEKFFNRFDMIFDASKKTQLARAISTAQMLKKEWRGGESDDIVWYMIEWEILSYFKWVPDQMKNGVNKFYEMFLNNLDLFDEVLVSDTFGGADFAVDFTHPYQFIDQDEYEKTKTATAPITRDALLEKKVNLEKREIYLNPIIFDLKRQLSSVNENRYSEDDMEKYWMDKRESDINEIQTKNTWWSKQVNNDDVEWDTPQVVN